MQPDNAASRLWLPEQHDRRCPARHGGACVSEIGCVASFIKALPDDPDESKGFEVDDGSEV